jgi:hypothetical protein
LANYLTQLNSLEQEEQTSSLIDIPSSKFTQRFLSAPPNNKSPTIANIEYENNKTIKASFN